jgi:signal transduction histidine kinase
MNRARRARLLTGAGRVVGLLGRTLDARVARTATAGVAGGRFSPGQPAIRWGSRAFGALRLRPRRDGAGHWHGSLIAESYDALAHTFAAQVVGLEGVRLLLLGGGAGEEVLSRVTQVGELARAGLAEAAYALESVGGPRASVVELLHRLAGDFARNAGRECPVLVSGDPEQLPAQYRLMVLRGAEEVLDTIRRHVPAAAVEVTLDRDPVYCELVVHGRPGDPAENDTEVALVSRVALGLRGIRERVETVGGTVRVTPAGAGFAVRIRLPA